MHCSADLILTPRSADLNLTPHSSDLNLTPRSAELNLTPRSADLNLTPRTALKVHEIRSPLLAEPVFFSRLWSVRIDALCCRVPN